MSEAGSADFIMCFLRVPENQKPFFDLGYAQNKLEEVCLREIQHKSRQLQLILLE
ncbi:hypothetical protein [Pseudovibrio ascidiaceicola]|uniref:hypothetical protein n=1 Tax=Pseudovibrio ascidiaceicola TaxID=285279 RepID=UPI001AD8AD91|nr:hypothetical protein [Pseudovibrio ascidiaceicola]